MKSAPRPLRALLCALAVLSALPGCDNSPDPTPDAGTPMPSEDSGTPPPEPDAGPWDGTYTVLEEKGDYVDRGRHAPCAFRFDGDPTTVSCSDLSRYDLAECSPEALAQHDPHGTYMLDTRVESRLSDGGTRVAGGSGSFLLRSDGGPDLVLSAPAVTRITDGGTFFLVGSRSNPITGTTITSYAGCQVPRTGRITGCFARCVGGRYRQSGTFEAWRMTWPEGEEESSGGLRLVSESPTPLGEAVDVYVAKDHAYVVSVNSRDGRAGGLTVFDVSDREHPVLKSTISLPGDSSWNGVWAQGDALYVAGNSTGAILYNIANPAAPQFVRSLPIASGTSTHTVLVDGDRLYAMAPEGMTFVFDISTPLAPRLVQSIALSEEFSLGGPHDAYAYQGRLYLSNAWGGYSVVDVTDLNNVRHLGQYVYPGGYAHHSQVTTMAGRTLAFEGGEFPASHLRVLDVTDPANIVKIGEYRKRPVTSIHNLLLRGSLLYIAWYQEGLRVLDVSNPTRPREVAHFNTFRETDPHRGDNVFEGAYGVRVPGDGHVYVVDSSRGLLILNEL